MTHIDLVLAILRSCGRGDLAEQAQRHGISVLHVDTRHAVPHDPSSSVQAELWHLTVGDDALAFDGSLLRTVDRSVQDPADATVCWTLVGGRHPTVESVRWSAARGAEA
ncbi:hypothetical protein Sked_15310 [Sanguibacter keddieii DSM 10542]|uniref:Uncharacterized protein n=1 Tax=Sanguibacter keddieii (strain ATCC 51767 / DSM 10542 / NCFB 3025 / ST-74) TaxID=446469 RepID=D1BFV5_SANKS|nr:hypothetical protein [Sanguibacter keddieii]ACZ21466.1 hypothetical protein Sked_15310 [Sanguibacter keddieii DSM 10542]